MFLHQHPYQPFLFKGVKKLIVGTLPPPRFSTGELRNGDVDFCYGSRDGQLWKILDVIFNLNLSFATTEIAVQERKDFLLENSIGICDIVASAKRKKIDASDSGMLEVRSRNMLGYLEAYPTIEKILFTGGNSKNGPEYLFRRHLKSQNIRMDAIATTIPRIHRFKHPKTHMNIHTVSLTAPSGAANRAIGGLAEYKNEKQRTPDFNTFDFRVAQYKNHF